MRNFSNFAKRAVDTAHNFRGLLQEANMRSLSRSMQNPVLAGQIAMRRPEFKDIRKSLAKEYHSAVTIGGDHRDYGILVYAIKTMEDLIKAKKLNPKELVIGWEREVREIKENKELHQSILAIIENPEQLKKVFQDASKQPGHDSQLSEMLKYALILQFCEKYNVPIFQLESDKECKNIDEVIATNDPDLIDDYIAESPVRRAGAMAQNLINAHYKYGKKNLVCFTGLIHSLELADATQKVFPEVKALSVYLATYYVHLANKDGLEYQVKETLEYRDQFMNDIKHIDPKKYEELKKVIEIVEMITLYNSKVGLSEYAVKRWEKVLDDKKPSPNPKDPSRGKDSDQSEVQR